MNTKPKVETRWLPDESLIITEISGAVSTLDVENWELGLNSAFENLPENSSFRIFVNLFGLAPQDVDVHKRFREIIPRSLARFGWKVGYLNMFPESENLKIEKTRGIFCAKAAHAHQDSYKINEYESRFGNEKERFFTNPDKALNWLRSH